jgi:hypothetical protein
MNWRWGLKRYLLTAFIVVHVAGLVFWNMPQSKLRLFAYQYLQYYFLPTGLNQYWAMFAPNPPMAQMRLEALTRDAKGILRSYAFPSMADAPIADAMWGFRLSKHMYNFDFEDHVAIRQVGAKHAVRQLDIPADSYPVEVELIYHLKPIPAPGEETKPLELAAQKTIERYKFPSRKEVFP